MSPAFDVLSRPFYKRKMMGNERKWEILKKNFQMLKREMNLRIDEFWEFLWIGVFEEVGRKKLGKKDLLIEVAKAFKSADWTLDFKRSYLNVLYYALKEKHPVELLQQTLFEYDRINRKFEGKGIDFRLDIEFVDDASAFNIVVEITTPLEELIQNFKMRFCYAMKDKIKQRLIYTPKKTEKRRALKRVKEEDRKKEREKAVEASPEPIQPPRRILMRKKS